jgi:hypothetical protein
VSLSLAGASAERAFLAVTAIKPAAGKFNSAARARAAHIKSYRVDRQTDSHIHMELIILLCANATPNWVW